MTKWMGAALAAAMLVTGCARVEGEKFVGHWVNVESKDDTIDIERNGESFMVRNTPREVIDAREQHRAGALRLRTPGGRYLDDHVLTAPPMTELRTLEAIAVRVERGDTDDSGHDVNWIRQLVAPGASLGGARPKAEFPSSDDRHDVGLWRCWTCCTQPR
ncbi:hypothetical protein NB693_25485 [Pantoea ananatis]|uniref:hypothetical protein n=1 Tax=Pantoea ananas TaxID=553 RepID=UPI00221FF6DC|nr:hypothetical protein [Pantoea ananatis]